MIISINGLSGCGKSSVGRMLAQKLGYKFYSAGDYRRLMARDMGLNIEELNKLGEKESFTDKKAEEWQTQLGLKENNFVITTRLSFMTLPQSIKVLLKVDPHIGTQRVFNDKEDPLRINQKNAHTLKEQEKYNAERDNSDVLRYKKWYDVDITDPKHYDIIIDTTNINIEQVVEKILEFIHNHS